MHFQKRILFSKIRDKIYLTGNAEKAKPWIAGLSVYGGSPDRLYTLQFHNQGSPLKYFSACISRNIKHVKANPLRQAIPTGWECLDPK